MEQPNTLTIDPSAPMPVGLHAVVRPLAWRVEVWYRHHDSGFYEHETQEQAEADAAQRTKDFGVLGFHYKVRPNISSTK